MNYLCLEKKQKYGKILSVCMKQNMVTAFVHAVAGTVYNTGGGMHNKVTFLLSKTHNYNNG